MEAPGPAEASVPIHQAIQSHLIGPYSWHRCENLKYHMTFTHTHTRTHIPLHLTTLHTLWALARFCPAVFRPLLIVLSISKPFPAPISWKNFRKRFMALFINFYNWWFTSCIAIIHSHNRLQHSITFISLVMISTDYFECETKIAGNPLSVPRGDKTTLTLQTI